MIFALYYILCQFCQKLAIHTLSENDVQQYMRALQRKLVMLHIYNNAQADNFVPISFKECTDKIYALCNSQF